MPSTSVIILETTNGALVAVAFTHGDFKASYQGNNSRYTKMTKLRCMKCRNATCSPHNVDISSKCAE